MATYRMCLFYCLNLYLHFRAKHETHVTCHHSAYGWRHMCLQILVKILGQINLKCTRQMKSIMIHSSLNAQLLGKYVISKFSSKDSSQSIFRLSFIQLYFTFNLCPPCTLCATKSDTWSIITRKGDHNNQFTCKYIFCCYTGLLTKLCA